MTIDQGAGGGILYTVVQGVYKVEWTVIHRHESASLQKSGRGIQDVPCEIIQQ
jgi:hypothetical protein